MKNKINIIIHHYNKLNIKINYSSNWITIFYSDHK